MRRPHRFRRDFPERPWRSRRPLPQPRPPASLSGDDPADRGGLLLSRRDYTFHQRTDRRPPQITRSRRVPGRGDCSGTRVPARSGASPPLATRGRPGVCRRRTRHSRDHEPNKDLGGACPYRTPWKTAEGVAGGFRVACLSAMQGQAVEVACERWSSRWPCSRVVLSNSRIIAWSWAASPSRSVVVVGGMVRIDAIEEHDQVGGANLLAGLTLVGGAGGGPWRQQVQQQKTPGVAGEDERPLPTGGQPRRRLGRRRAGEDTLGGGEDDRVAEPLPALFQGLRVHHCGERDVWGKIAAIQHMLRRARPDKANARARLQSPNSSGRDCPGFQFCLFCSLTAICQHDSITHIHQKAQSRQGFLQRFRSVRRCGSPGPTVAKMPNPPGGSPQSIARNQSATALSVLDTSRPHDSVASLIRHRRIAKRPPFFVNSSFGCALFGRNGSLEFTHGLSCAHCCPHSF